MFCKSTPVECNKIIVSDIVSNCNNVQLARSYHPTYHTITCISYNCCIYNRESTSQNLNVLHSFFCFSVFLNTLVDCGLNSPHRGLPVQTAISFIFWLVNHGTHHGRFHLCRCKPKQCRPLIRPGFQGTFWTAHKCVSAAACRTHRHVRHDSKKCEYVVLYVVHV